MVLTQKQADIDVSKKPNWRWKAAEFLAERSRHPYKTDEQLIRNATKYLRTSDEQRFPLIHASHAIYKEDGLLRAEIEARIVAEQTDDEIAKRCRISADLVKVYEALFFCVREYRHATDWILINVGGLRHMAGFRDHEMRQLLAWHALSGGLLIVEYLIDNYRKAACHGEKPSLSVYLREGCDVSRELQCAIATNVIPSNNLGNRWLIEFGLLQQKAQGIRDPRMQQEAFEELHDKVIECGRMFLAGQKPSVPPARKPSAPLDRSKGQSHHNATDAVSQLLQGVASHHG